MSARLLFCCFFFLTQVLLSAQAATKRPNPPSQICIGTNCATTPSGGTIKWNPGHYMASGSILYAGDTLTRISGEMADLNGWDQIRGYRVLTTWGALEPSKGKYDFTVLDQIMSRLKTSYGKPKQMVLVVLPGTFGGKLSGGDSGAIPAYIQQSAEYGPSPTAGSYGWWENRSGYCAALFRPAVMDRYIALIQALGAHFDGDPNFEAIMYQEDSWMIGEWIGAPDFNANGGGIDQLQRLLTASTAAFPHTSVVMQNTWAGTPQGTAAFQNWMLQNRIAAGSADVVGQTAISKYNFAIAWGLMAYAGVSIGGVQVADMRNTGRAMMDVESQELCGSHYAKYGGPYTPQDIIDALNQTYKASHAFWTHLYGTEKGYGVIPNSAKWPNLAAIVSTRPLTNTSYPGNY
jgi:Beta-galactosidase